MAELAKSWGEIQDEEKRLNAMKALFMAVSNSAGAAQRARAKEELDLDIG